ncbi:MAG: hypothetical protein EZS28_007258 [Streblomastix strix]|uniref:Uncharacterized protein n=1 Tax=Streblomastix strix TaxID=222440 RepID=A0A5J4WRM3_9EUKA|nr:MAG: hypothetical protein EZS28_007258 [Streblomastix strix]
MQRAQQIIKEVAQFTTGPTVDASALPKFYLNKQLCVLRLKISSKVVKELQTDIYTSSSLPRFKRHIFDFIVPADLSQFSPRISITVIKHSQSPITLQSFNDNNPSPESENQQYRKRGKDIIYPLSKCEFNIGQSFNKMLSGGPMYFLVPCSNRSKFQVKTLPSTIAYWLFAGVKHVQFPTEQMVLSLGHVGREPAVRSVKLTQEQIDEKLNEASTNVQQKKKMMMQKVMSEIDVKNANKDKKLKVDKVEEESESSEFDSEEVNNGKGNIEILRKFKYYPKLLGVLSQIPPLQIARPRPRPLNVQVVLFWCEAGSKMVYSDEDRQKDVATDARSEYVQSRAAIFETKENIQQEGQILEMRERGFFFEEINISSDRRAPLLIQVFAQLEIEDIRQKNKKNQNTQQNVNNDNKKYIDVPLLTAAVSLLKPSNTNCFIKQEEDDDEEEEDGESILGGVGDTYFIRLMDQSTGFSLSLTLKTQHIRPIRRSFPPHIPLFSVDLGVFLNFRQLDSTMVQNEDKKSPFPPIIIVRAIKDWANYWENIQEGIDDPTGIDAPKYLIGYSHNSLPFVCTPVKKGPQEAENLIVYSQIEQELRDLNKSEEMKKKEKEREKLAEKGKENYLDDRVNGWPGWSDLHIQLFARPVTLYGQRSAISIEGQWNERRICDDDEIYKVKEKGNGRRQNKERN